MKIALVSPYDFAYPGGVVNHISCLEQQFTRMGHEVKIIAPASKAVYTSDDRFIHIGTPRPVPVSGSIARVTVSVRLASQINAVFEQEKFDICHLHEPLMPTLCTTTLRLKHTLMVGTFHASGARPWYTWCTPLGKWYLDRWFRKLDGRIAVSPSAREYVRSYFPAEYTIIPNGIDVEHFNCNVSPIDIFNDGKLNILFVGRLEKRKGFDYLLKATNLRRIPWIRFSAPILLLIIYTRYTFHFTTTLAFLTALIGVCLYIKITSTRTTTFYYSSTFISISIVLYYLAGGAFLLFAIVCAIYELFFRSRWKTSLFYLLSAALIPYIVGVLYSASV